MTNLATGPGPHPEVVRGVSCNGNGGVILHANGSCSAPSCPTEVDIHSFKVEVESVGAMAPTISSPTVGLVTPPFDTLPGAVPPCTVSGGTLVTCRGLLRISAEGTRNIVGTVEWRIDGQGSCPGSTVPRQPSRVTLQSTPSAQQALFIDTIDVGCRPMTGVFRLYATSPDVTVADTAFLEIPYTVP